jgi:predicted transcriptional regulator
MTLNYVSVVWLSCRRAIISEMISCPQRTEFTCDSVPSAPVHIVHPSARIADVLRIGEAKDLSAATDVPGRTTHYTK